MRREINRRNFFTYTVSLWRLNTNISLVKNEQLHSILINTVSPELISSLNYYSLKYTKKFLIKFIIKIFLLYHFLTYLSFLDKDAQITLKNKRATMINKKIKKFWLLIVSKSNRREDRAKIERNENEVVLSSARRVDEKRLLVVPR